MSKKLSTGPEKIIGTLKMPSPVTPSDLTKLFPGDTEMARRMRDFDWSNSYIGRPESWPQNLRVAISICLTSRFPMHVWWGPSLTLFYNDAYISFSAGANIPPCSAVRLERPGLKSGTRSADAEDAYLRFGAAAGMSESYTRAVDGFVIGPLSPSCGTAAYTGQTVIVRDVAQDPLWAPYLDLAREHGIRACWSFPIRSFSGKVLGTFAVYHRMPREPEPSDLESASLFAHTAAILIERHKVAEERGRAEEALRESEERFRTMADNSPIIIWLADVSGRLTFVNRAYVEFLDISLDQIRTFD